MNKLSDFISTREAARLLGVGLTTVQQWVETGALPAWKTAGGHRRIPAAAIEAIRSQQQAALGTRPAPATASFKVLMVEDEPVQREIYCRELADWGLPLQIFSAADGFEALMVIGRHAPDLIITDLVMPGMDGFEMIRKLVAQPSVFKGSIVVLTALGPEQIEALGGLPPGISVYPKPVSFADLRPLVERMMRQTVA